MLTNSIIEANSVDFDDKVSIFETLDSLTEQDMKVFSVFATGNTVRVDQFYKNIGIRGSSEDEVLSKTVVSLSKLQARGVIGETTPATWDSIGGTGDPSAWFNAWRAKSFIILPFGKLFLKLLHSNATEPSAKQASQNTA